MLSYARDDTHYLLYIYDKMRLELWERGNGQPVQLQVVWQRSRDICLKVTLCRPHALGRAPPSRPGPLLSSALHAGEHSQLREGPRAPFWFASILNVSVLP